LLPDLEKIMKECEIERVDDDNLLIDRINRLPVKYDNDSLVIVYSCLIKRARSLNVISHLIRCINNLKYSASLDVLMEVVLRQGHFAELDRLDENFIHVRIMAIKAVSNLKDTRAVVGLLDCLNNKNENYKIRLNCADALGRIGDKYAVMPLMNVVTDEEEKSSFVRESAATALGMLGDMRAIESLVSILETKKGLIDKFTFLKERAIEALSKFHYSSDRVIKALKNSLLDESPQIRINAIEALMNTEDDRAFDLIKKMLFDKDEEVVNNAVIALYNLRGREILDEILQDEQYNIFCKTQAQYIIDEYEYEE